jgi:hypothetical protein
MTADSPLPERDRPNAYTTEQVVAHHGDPVWEAIWATIKGWDISRTANGPYHAPTGDDATAIYDAIRGAASAVAPLPIAAFVEAIVERQRQRHLDSGGRWNESDTRIAIRELCEDVEAVGLVPPPAVAPEPESEIVITFMQGRGVDGRPYLTNLRWHYRAAAPSGYDPMCGRCGAPKSMHRNDGTGQANICAAFVALGAR